jgi:hypothetical protein
MRGGVISDFDTFSNNDIESKNNCKGEKQAEHIISDSNKQLYQSDTCFSFIKGSKQ